jgi:hypothetical protein
VKTSLPTTCGWISSRMWRLLNPPTEEKICGTPQASPSKLKHVEDFGLWNGFDRQFAMHYMVKSRSW